jgi:hypothetical protein
MYCDFSAFEINGNAYGPIRMRDAVRLRAARPNPNPNKSDFDSKLNHDFLDHQSAYQYQFIGPILYIVYFFYYV